MKYRNASSEVQTLIGHGIVNPGETIEIGVLVENPNFVSVSDEQRSEPAPAILPPAPAFSPTPAEEQPNN